MPARTQHTHARTHTVMQRILTGLEVETDAEIAAFNAARCDARLTAPSPTYRDTSEPKSLSRRVPARWPHACTEERIEVPTRDGGALSLTEDPRLVLAGLLCVHDLGELIIRDLPVAIHVRLLQQRVDVCMHGAHREGQAREREKRVATSSQSSTCRVVGRRTRC